MAYSKVILNGTVLMDVTQDTVDAANLLSGETATKNSGAKVTGAYTPPTFSTQSKTVSPSTTSQTVQPDSGYDGLSSVTVNAMPSGTAGTPTATKGTVSNHAVSVTPSVTNTTGYITGGTKTGTAVSVSASELVSGTLTISSGGTKDVTNYASASVATGSASTPATSITANPSISVSSGGLITATASASKSVTPTVSEGYVTEGTAGTVTVSGSNTQQLTTQAAQTITPTTTNQTIASGKYLTGAQTILGDANLLAENIKKDVSIFGVTGTLEGGGGMNTLTLYANNESILYTDSACTDPVYIDRFDYDYSAAYSYFQSFDSIKVVYSQDPYHYTMFITNISFDSADDSLNLYAFHENTSRSWYVN